MDFSGKIINATYADEAHSIIKVRYEDNGQINIWNVTNDPNLEDYKELMSEGWDPARILDETIELKKAESKAFNILVNESARELLKGMKKETKNQEAVDTLNDSHFDFIVNTTDKDVLFKFKIWALETEDMKAASKEHKSRIRKAKTMLEAFSILNEVKSSL